MRKKWMTMIYLLLGVLLVVPPTTSQPGEESNGNITFQPNVMPDLVVIPRVGRNNESFRFEWLGNRFDIELAFNTTMWRVHPRTGINTSIWSLKDFEDDFNVTVSYEVNKNDSMCQFGWVIDNVENVSDFVHNAWFKIENIQPFDYDDIKLDIYQIPGDDVNVTRLKFPDNLDLSFDDLRHKGFIVGWQNKTATEVKGLRGKASWDLDPIVESGGVITITDYPSNAPADFDEIYTQIGNASIFAKHNAIQFSSAARIIIGNGTSAGTAFLNETTKQLTFNASSVTSNSQYLFEVTSYGHLHLGNLEDANAKTSSLGVDVVSLNTAKLYIRFIRAYYPTSATVELYSCRLYGNAYLGHYIECRIIGYDTPIYNCGFDYTSIYQGNCDVFNLDLYRSYYGFQIVQSGTFNRIFAFENSFVCFFYGAYSMTITNLLARQNTYIADCYLLTSNNYIVNGDVDLWHFQWGSSSGEVYRQYEYDLTVTYPNGTVINGTSTGARVVIQHYGQGGAVDYNATLGDDGTIPTQTLTMGFYNQTGGNTIYSYNDYNLEVSNVTGYEDYSGNFTHNRLRNLQIALTPTPLSVTYTSAILVLALFIIVPIGVLLWWWKR